MKLFRGEKTEGLFLESILMWKNTHPDFGFPTLEDIKSYSKREDLPQIPARLQKLLFKIGASSISEQDYENIVSNLFYLSEEDRMSYLLSVFPLLNEEERVHTLVISVLSDHIYNSCKFLGRDVFRLLNPLFEVIHEIVEDRHCFSETLELYASQFSKEGIAYSSSYVLELIIARIILNGMHVKEMLSNSDPLVSLLFTILRDLCSDGLQKKMEILTSNIPILQTIKFSVEESRFLEWIMDLLDSLYMSTWFLDKIISRSKMMKTRHDQHISPYKKDMLKLLLEDKEDSISISMGSKGAEKIFKLKVDSPVSGIVRKEFVPLSEEDQEEYNDGFEFDEEIEDYLSFEEKGKTKQLAFCKIVGLDLIGLASVRGTAHDVVIKTNILDRKSFSCHGNKTIFQRKKYRNLYDMINNYGSYVLMVSENRKKLNIEHYQKIELSDFFKQESKLISPEVEIEGKCYNKLEVLSTPKLLNKITSLDQYFKRVGLKEAEKILTQAEKKEELLSEIGVGVRDDFKNFRRDLKKRVDDLRRENSTKLGKKEERKQKISTKESKGKEFNIENFKDLVDNIINFDGSFLSLPSVNRKTKNPDNFNFKSPLRLMSDPEFIGEFNALFPNMWTLYERNELRMTAISKEAKLERAKAKLSLLPPDMRGQYSKIYLLVAALLNDIDTCESIHHETHELSYEIDKIFSVKASPSEDVNLLGYLEPQAGYFLKEPDLDRIFRD
jgi:hypothetical protein